MAKANTSSVKTVNSEKLAGFSNDNKNSMKVSFTQKSQDKQIINARKGVNLELAKKKAKKKAKMVKASKRRNK